jgi:hypothetical protein
VECVARLCECATYNRRVTVHFCHTWLSIVLLDAPLASWELPKNAAEELLKVQDSIHSWLFMLQMIPPTFALAVNFPFAVCHLELSMLVHAFCFILTFTQYFHL